MWNEMVQGPCAHLQLHERPRQSTVLNRLNIIIDRLNVISSGSVHPCLSEVYPRWKSMFLRGPYGGNIWSPRYGKIVFKVNSPWKIQHSHARTWRSGSHSSLSFPVPIPIELIAIKVIAVIPYLVIITFWILFSKSLNIQGFQLSVGCIVKRCSPNSDAQNKPQHQIAHYDVSV
jgi:hypothetical protein